MPTSFFLSCTLSLLMVIHGCRSLVAQDEPRYRVMFYNVENLFDIHDDNATNDEEFLPEGEKKWTQEKFYKKLNNIYRVILHCGEWNPPALVGLCEVENRLVLEKLVFDTPLEKFDYRVIHFDSPDRRGIDVALLYRSSSFQPDTAYPLTVRFPFDTAGRTRDILYVKGKVGNMEEVHIFVNHWPSRYGGYQATVEKRKQAARVLRGAVDSLLALNPEAAIIIMGDLNDGPLDESLAVLVEPDADSAGIHTGSLTNLTATYEYMDKTGTLKYKENWDVFDQLIVSKSLMSGDLGLKVTPSGAIIFRPHYLLTDDEKYLGEKPFRTYAGYKYLGGFSDHLPVYFDLVNSGAN